MLDLKGVPTMVERTLIRPPMSRLGPVAEEERAELLKASPVYGLYDQAVDRDSAYELLAHRAEAAAERRETSRAERKAPPTPRASGRLRHREQRASTATERFVKNMAGSVGREVGNMIVRQVVRGILGGLSRR